MAVQDAGAEEKTEDLNVDNQMQMTEKNRKAQVIRIKRISWTINRRTVSMMRR